MARILAVDWDGVEVRFVLGSILKDRLIVSNVGSAPIEIAAEEAAAAVEDDEEEYVYAPSGSDVDEDGDEDDGVVETVEKEYIPRMPVADDEDEDEEETSGDLTVVSTVKKASFKNSPIAVTLKKLFHQRRVGSATLCYTAERGDLDVMYMTIPNASESETPELIFNQALRDSLTFNENQPLDFMTLGLPDSPKKTGFRKVAAVSIARDKLRRIRETLAGAYRAPAKIELREPSLAEFLRADFCGLAYEEPVILVQELCDEANLTLCYQKSVLYFRSFKILPEATSADRAERIREEIVRTLAVGVDDLPEDATVNRALLFTDYTRPKLDSEEDDEEGDDAPERVATILERLLEEEEIQLDFLNPFRLAGMRVKVQEPENSGRYASLLGVLLAERPQNKPAVDLLHPHEKPKPPNFTLLFVAYFLIVILAATGAYFWNKSDLKKLNAELETLEKSRQQVVYEYNQKAPLFNVLRNANIWQNVEGVIVLDELRDIAARLPKSPDLVVTRLAYMAKYTGQASPQSQRLQNRPVFIISAKITGLEVYTQFKRNMEYGGVHEVVSNLPTNNPGGGGYTHMFEAFIICGRRNAESLLAVQSDEIKQISRERPEYFVELEEEQKRLIAEAQEKNFKDASALVENTNEVLNADPATPPAEGEGEAPVTTIEQDSEYRQKLVQTRLELRQSFENVKKLKENGALTPEQFNTLNAQFTAKEAEIVKKWEVVNARVQIKTPEATLENARKILDAVREEAKEPTPQVDEKLCQTLVGYRKAINSAFKQTQWLLDNGVIDQAKFDAAKEKLQKEDEEIVKEYNEVFNRIKARNSQNEGQQQPAPEQPAAPAEEQPAPEQPAAPAEEQPAPEQPAAPAEEQSAPEQPAAPAGEQPAPEQPAAPAEGQPAPEQPAAPAEGQPAPEQPAAPAEEQPAPEQPAAPAEDQPAPEQPAAPAEDQPASEQPAAPAEDQSAPEAPPQASSSLTTRLEFV